MLEGYCSSHSAYIQKWHSIVVREHVHPYTIDIGVDYSQIQLALVLIVVLRLEGKDVYRSRRAYRQEAVFPYQLRYTVNVVVGAASVRSTAEEARLREQNERSSVTWHGRRSENFGHSVKYECIHIHIGQCGIQRRDA